MCGNVVVTEDTEILSV